MADNDRRDSGAPSGGRPVSADDFVLERYHGDSLLRRLSRGAMRPFRPADDVQALTEHGTWIQHPVTTGRRIAVTGLRGGAGKSTVAALISAVFARYRQDRVLALDLDPELGTLPLRLGMAPGRSLAELARSEPRTASFEEIGPLLTRLGERLWAVPATRGTLGGDPLDAEIYRTAGMPLSRFFGVTVTDSGAGLRTGLHDAVLSAAHAHILVTPATSIGAASAGRALDWMATNGHAGLLPRTIAVFTFRSPHMTNAVDLNKAKEILAEAGVETMKLGFDRHMAVGSSLDPTMVAQATKDTAIALAAGSLRLALEA